MFSLIILLLMNTIITEIPLQATQIPIVVDEQQFNRQSMWYTDRPIDARTQTRNRYLDSVKLTKKQTVASGAFYNPTRTKTTLSWNLSWELDWMYVIVPENWTYQIQTDVFIERNLWVWYLEIYPASWPITRETVINKNRNIQITDTKNLRKWDKLNVWIWNFSDTEVDFEFTLTITKLS